MSEPLTYRTILKPGQDVSIINKSRFIGQIAPVKTEEEAVAFIRSVKQTYADARHHCYAYILGVNAGLMRYSDDGEPGGTAGMPMMDVLRGKGLTNCCAVVTRYFGGILLGTGGLVRAYTQGCSLAVADAGIAVMEQTDKFLCELPYPMWDKFQHDAADLPVQLSETSFTTAVSFSLSVRCKDTDAVLERLTQMTFGQIETLKEDTGYRPWTAEGE